MSRKFLFLLGSSRTGGNTEALARLAAEQLPTGTEQRWLNLSDLPLPDFEDLRHEGEGNYPAPTGHAATLLDATLEATDLVIASPLYWYSLTTSTKRYLDHWSGWMRVPGVDFKPRMAGRTLWGVTALADSDRSAADPLVGTLNTIASYMKMEWGGVLLGNGSRPGDVLNDIRAQTEAKAFFAPRTPVPPATP
ncbi:flavodoxin family protein [Streptomyces maoxianensis]|uniref:Flavodoxin family protein n=1 Tax=Streptomyces maoxianensis TaxID=1459942 RepID=A0ABV9FX66_9ACTN|nr:NAD(P)H-dependent oxidoreductase [Streptomyces sp. ISL-1]MBT2390868.1 NAD(P)H-dependent oxidoreductase [Streptomyces sp. ISL-1]